MKHCLKCQKITVVGQLAQLSEAEISLLPIKSPKLETLIQALDKCGATTSKASAAKTENQAITVDKATNKSEMTEFRGQRTPVIISIGFKVD